MAKQVAAVSGLQPYPAYKPSGVEWLGEVPAHWGVRRLRQLGTLAKGSGGSKDDEVSAGIPCVRYGDLYTTHTRFIRGSRAFVSPERASSYTLLKNGDVLFAASGETIDEIGKSAVNLMTSETRCGGDIIVFRPTRRTHAPFMGYVTDCWSSAAQKATMGRGFTVIHIYSTQLKQLLLPVPSLPEQAAIARYLDHADRRIRRCIQAKEKLVKLLEEQRRALVSEAVTGRVDVRTRQPYEDYKPSHADWLGNVPEHWETRPSKRTFTPRKEFARPNDIQLSATQAYGVIAQEDYEEKVGRKIVRIFRHLEKRRHVEVDDFVISMRSFQGGLERAWVTGCIRSSYVVLQPATTLDVGYFSHLFKSTGYIAALQSTANFIRDGQDLTFENFCGVDLPFPPFEEQRRIAKFLDRVTSDIATTIDCFRSEIDSLGEYRTRLIADVVTGKLDVRQADQIPDEIEEPEFLAASDVQASVVAEAAGQLDAGA